MAKWSVCRVYKEHGLMLRFTRSRKYLGTRKCLGSRQYKLGSSNKIMSLNNVVTIPFEVSFSWRRKVIFVFIVGFRTLWYLVYFEYSFGFFISLIAYLLVLILSSQNTQQIVYFVWSVIKCVWSLYNV